MIKMNLKLYLNNYFIICIFVIGSMMDDLCNHSYESYDYTE